MHLTLQQAAQRTGRNRTSILRAIKRGDITGTKDAEGNWSVDAAELTRVYGGETQRPTPMTAQTDALVAELRATIKRMDAVADDLRADRDHWRNAFEQMQRRLPAPSPTTAQADAQPSPVAQASPAPIAAPSTGMDSGDRLTKAGMAAVHSAPPVERRSWWRRLTG